MYLEEIRSRARDTLRGNWKKFIGYTIIIHLLTTLVENRLSVYFPNPIKNELTKYISFVINWDDYLTFIYYGNNYDWGYTVIYLCDKGR